MSVTNRESRQHLNLGLMRGRSDGSCVGRCARVRSHIQSGGCKCAFIHDSAKFKPLTSRCRIAGRQCLIARSTVHAVAHNSLTVCVREGGREGRRNGGGGGGGCITRARMYVRVHVLNTRAVSRPLDALYSFVQLSSMSCFLGVGCPNWGWNLTGA